MQNQGRRTRDEQNKKNKHRTSTKVFMAAVLVILIAIAGGLVYTYQRLSLMNQPVDFQGGTLEPESEDPDQTNVPDIASDDLSKIQNKASESGNLFSDSKLINVLLLGLDTRDPEQFTGGRTDSMIIMTLDRANNEIKLTSIMRDTLVSIPGHDMNRINTVFGFSGPDVAMQTVQKYFGVKIDYYAIVNFWAVANIIDSVGGVTVDVKSDEVKELNTALDTVNKYAKGSKSPKVAHSGSQKLNGKQAVSYMRIRHIGEGDFQRTERQRTVLEAIAHKDMSLTDALKVVNSLPDNVRTNINQTEMINLAKIAYGMKGAPIKQLRLPYDGSYKMSKYKKMSILVVDFDKNAEKLKEFLTEK